MPYTFYKILHVAAVIVVFTSLGGLAVAAHLSDPKPLRKLLSILHGVGLLMLIVAGFGLLAKLPIEGFPMWLSIKLALWLLLGAALAILKNKPDLTKVMVLVLPVIGITAAALGIFKPF